MISLAGFGYVGAKDFLGRGGWLVGHAGGWLVASEIEMSLMCFLGAILALALRPSEMSL